MSLLAIGTPCTTCHTQDYLPQTCPTCTNPFCKDHIQTHSCLPQFRVETNPIAGPSSFAVKAKCEVKGCGRASIQAIAGIELGNGRGIGKREEGEGEGAGVAREVRCGVCNGAFCTAHRRQQDHSCPGPLDYKIYEQASIARKLRADEIIAERFAGRKVVGKPPVQRDVDMSKGLLGRGKGVSPERSSMPAPKLSLHESQGAGTGAEVEVKKTKAEKLFEIQLRKLRSLANPLDGTGKGQGGGQGVGERRFFEWGVDLEQRGLGMEQWEGKSERVWVDSGIPVGKVLDLIVVQGKVVRPKTAEAETALGLIAISTPPSQPRQILSLDLSNPASSIPEGSLVLLIRGPLTTPTSSSS